MQKLLPFFLLCLASMHAIASTPIQNVNNQATFDAEYIPTQINRSPPADNSEYLKGHQLGTQFGLTKTIDQHIYTHISLDAMAGNLSYGKDTIVTTATSFLQQINLRLGYSFFPTQRSAFTPYLVTGYQYWQLDTGGKYEKFLTINGSTKFYQNGIYGLGLLSQFAATPRVVLNLDAMLGKTYNPWMRYNAPEVPNSVIGTNIIYQQASLAPQLFYQAGVSIDYKVTAKIHANAGIQYNHTEYSSAVTHPSKIAQPHFSIATTNYNLGLGYTFEPDDQSENISYLPDTVSTAILKANNLASLSAGYVCQGYAETLPRLGHYFDRQEGNIPVVALAINKSFERIYTQLVLSEGTGDTGYRGESFSTSAYKGTSPLNVTTRNTLYDIGARLGYMFFPHEKLGLTPYFTGGFHRWLRDTAGITDDGYITSGYPETYQNAWYALGLLMQFNPYQYWVLNVDGNFGTTNNAENKSWNSFYSPRTYQQVFSLKQRFQYNIGVGADYRFAQNWHALAQINYWYFKYGLSATSKIDVFEPNSTTRQLSVMLGIGYALDNE